MIFDGQGATKAANPTNIAVVPPNVTVGILPSNPEKTGYIFGGWYKGTGGTGGAFTASTVVSSNMTVYANWESYEYTVTFDDQGATTPVSPTSKTVASPNTTVGSLPSEPENTGYYFGGWNTKADGTGTIFTASTPVTDNIRVYAIWMNNPTRIVTFDSQGATTFAGPTTIEVISPNVTVGSLPTAPEKTGYIFGGWFREPEGGGGEFTASSVVAEDITVYANWESYRYTVTYDSQDADTEANPTSVIVESPNTRIGQRPSNPVKTGYTFGGWFTEPNGQGTQFLASTVVNSDIRVYAKWTANSYDIYYYDQDGKAFSGTHGNNYPTSHTYGTDTVLDIPTKDSYIFDGWYTNSSCSGSPVTRLNATAYTRYIQLYAKWTCYLTYTNDGNNISITGLTTEGKSLSSIVIPSEIGGKTVTNISSEAFMECTNINNITIPNTITSIGEIVFDGCSELTSITIPSSVISIGAGAFSRCTNLTSIIIPASVTNIGASVFSGCEKLTSATIQGDVLTIGSRLFSGCTNLASVTIPNSVTSIGEQAFEQCNSLRSITIPNGVTSIGASAFSSCSSLTNITIPNGVTSIGNSTFSGCSSLTSITIPNGVTSIGEWAFAACGLESLTIPTNVTSIGEAAFYDSKLTNITIPAGVTSIGDQAFSYCMRLTNITVDGANSAFSSDEGVLYNKEKTKILVYPRSLSGSVEIPNTVTSIGNYAFENCYYLTNITIPTSVTRIGNYAFCSCNITSITIPTSVSSIGSYAFSRCGLRSITIERDTPPSCYNNTFNDCGFFSKIYVPASAVSTYKAANGWKNYANLIEGY